MLSTVLPLFVIGFALGTGIFAAVSARRAVRYAQNAENFAQESLDWVQKNNSKSLSLAKMAEVEAALTELSDSYSALLTSHKKLRSRIGMREYREKKANGDATQDTDADYASRKMQLRDKAKSKGYL